MQAIVKAEAKQGIELQRNLPEPTLEKDEVLVQVAATSICGTDLELYEWSQSAQGFDPALPFVMGHECAGTVVEVGPGVEGLAVGDRVAAESHIFCGRCYMCSTGNAHNCEHLKILGITWDGAFAEFVRLPASVCFRLPESVLLEIGALFEPAGVAVHALQRAQSVAGRNILVCGCGPIGLTVIQLATLFGASRVFAIEPNPFRRDLAASLGASTVDPRTQSLGDPRNDVEIYAAVYRGVRENTDLLLHPTLGYITQTDVDDRIKHILAVNEDPHLRVDLVPVDFGLVNVDYWNPESKYFSSKDLVYHNPQSRLEHTLATLKSHGVHVGVVAWNVGQARTARCFREMNLFPEPTIWYLFFRLLVERAAVGEPAELTHTCLITLLLWPNH